MLSWQDSSASSFPSGGQTGTTQSSESKSSALVQKHWDEKCRPSNSLWVFRYVQLTLFWGMAFSSPLCLIAVHLLPWYSKHLKTHTIRGIKEPYLQMLSLSQMKFPDPRWKIGCSLIINIEPITLECSQSRPVPHCSSGLLCQHHKVPEWRSWTGGFWRSTCLSPRQALEM